MFRLFFNLSVVSFMGLFSFASFADPLQKSYPISTSLFHFEYFHHEFKKAIREGNFETAKRLIKQGQVNPNTLYNNPTAIYDDNAMYLLTNGDHSQIIQLLIENGVDVNAKYNPDKKFNSKYVIDHCDDWTLLHWASERGNLKVVRVLIENGANVNAKGGWWGETPLSLAIGKGHIEIVRVLIENGAKEG